MDHALIQKLSTSGRHQKCYRRVGNFSRKAAHCLEYAGKSLLALGHYEKAQCLAKAHQIDKNDPEIIKDIGNIFNSMQNTSEAVKFYKYALSIDPNYAPAMNNLGLIAKSKGDLVAAEILIKRAIDLDQLCCSYYINLGTIYQEIGSLDKALSSTLEALKLESNNLMFS